MKKIKFNTSIFDLANDVVRESASIRVTILKEDNTLSSVAPVVDGVDSIEVYDDDELVATYNGFTHLFALNLYKNYPIYDGTYQPVISIELEDANLQGQIDNLIEQMNEVQEIQDAHTNNIAELNEEVSELTPYTDTKRGYYGETEKTFYNVPSGNVSVFFDNYNGDYSTNRIGDTLTVSFDALIDETNITISIQ